MGMFIRALAYMLSHGADGLRQVAEDAVLNANYILAELKDHLSPAYEGLCMHEALFDERFLKGTGVSVLDFTKALIDEGFHPMTMHFPLVVNGALLIEPTECESKASLDLFIGAMKHLTTLAKDGQKAHFEGAPYYTPRRRLDETRAARQHVLRWKKNETEERNDNGK
jgi:glycine dehydrogenase subunit 2